MLLSESTILDIIEEETRACIKESLLLEQITWKVPGDNSYEYSLTPDGKSYIAYEGGKPIGTFSDAAGLEKVKAAAPQASKQKKATPIARFPGLAIVWNNENAKPISNALKSTIPAEILDSIPQGHAGLIIVDSNKRATAVDFGAGDTWGCKVDQVGWGRNSRAAYGILTHGGFRVLSNGTARIEKDGSISRDEVKRLLSISPMSSAKAATEWGVVLNFDAGAVLSRVGANKSTCSPYSIMPSIPSLPAFLRDPKKKWLEGDGDNCGSMAVKLVKLGSGFLKGVPISMAQKLLFAPDQVVGLLRMLRVFSVSS